VYTEQFLPLTAQDLRSLDVPLNTFTRRKTKNQPTFRNALLHFPATHGGLRAPALSDSIPSRTWGMTQHAVEKVALAADVLLDRAARISGSLTISGHPSASSPITTRSTWGSCFEARDLPTKD